MANLRKNTFKAAIHAGKMQRGLWCTINESLVAEMCAHLGFDWLLFDMEHSALDSLNVLPLLQVAAAYPTNSIVRPGSLDPVEIKKLLDMGAQNILVPMVNTAEEAALAVASVEYPPTGIRGMAGLTRATGFGDITDYHLTARSEIAILVQVETKQALDNLEAIAAVPGIDGIFLGPADLAAALGYAGDTSNPHVQDVAVDTIKRIVATGKAAGFLSLDMDFVDKVIAAGATFVANDVDLGALKRGLISRM